MIEHVMNLHPSPFYVECGYTESDIINASPRDMELYYSREKQSQYGVVGIKISLVMKKSVYFLGRSISNNIVCQESEVCEAMFVPFFKAIELLTFEDTKKILKAADIFINSVQLF